LKILRIQHAISRSPEFATKPYGARWLAYPSERAKVIPTSNSIHKSGFDINRGSFCGAIDGNQGNVMGMRMPELKMGLYWNLITKE